MKRLRNYVVNGAVLQGGSGSPVIINDLVRLYLDNQSEPGFPEYINAVVVHPIVSVQCGTATSYSFEYDEADLLGAKAYLLNGDVVDVQDALDAAAGDVSDLTTEGLTAGNLLRVAAGGGLEERTPAQTLSALSGEGDPNVAAVGHTASYLGQLYRDTTNNVWYRAISIDPSVWERDAGTPTPVDGSTELRLAPTLVALRGVVTTTSPTGSVIGQVVSGALAFYELQAGTDADAPPTVIRPDDYNASTNAKIWKQVL